MDVDLESVEIVFAQRLASGEPVVRAHALRELHKWIKTTSAKKPFEEEDLMRLCKGLHYVMWMQDKMINQEDLADNISSLVTIFESEDESALYVKCFFAALSKEWQAIDRWRMDKFLMLIRRLVRSVFLHLASLGWKKAVTEKYWAAFKATVMSNDRAFRDALKYHFASIFLDELDNAGNITTERVTELVRTFSEMFTTDISDYIFQGVADEVFTTILHAMSDEMRGEEEEEEEGEGEEGEEGEDKMEAESSGEGAEEKEDKEPKREGIKFDYGTIGRELFSIGAQPSVTSKRRAKLYELAKKFEMAASGKDPMAPPDIEVKELITGRQHYNAIQRAVAMQMKTRNGKEQGRKTRKQLRKMPKDTDFTNGLADMMDLNKFKPTEKKFKGEVSSKHTGKRNKITKKVTSGGSINKKKQAKGLGTGAMKASAIRGANGEGGGGGKKKKWNTKPKKGQPK